MAKKIADLLTIEEVFGKEVNIVFSIEDDADSIRRLNSYVPTTQSVSALESITDGLAPNSPNRSHLITGQYGTGKSHLGLVLVNLFQYKHESDRLNSFIEKIRNKDKEAATKILRNREIMPKPFLIVIPEVSVEKFDFALLSSLKDSLERARVDFEPDTYFKEAIISLEKIAQDSVLGKRLDDFLDSKNTNADLIKKGLNKFNAAAYNNFCEAHIKITTAQFAPQTTAKACDVFLEVAKHLRKEEGYEGIVVVADEFGNQLTQLAKDPEGKEGATVQNFASRCNASRENQIHFIAIAHRTLADYATGKRSADDWTKISGRFEEHNLNLFQGQEYEIVDIINSVVTQNTTVNQVEWEELAQSYGKLRDWIKNSGIFSGMDDEWVYERLLKGCYPLHPATVLCLPWISQRLGQEKRTAIRFLTAQAPGGVVEFIKDENVFVGQKPNLYMPEKLIEYFEVAASENIKYRNLLNSRLDAISKYGQEPTALRIFNLLTVLSIVSHPLIQPTRDLITTLLSTKNTDNVADVLDTLTDQRTLRYRKETDRYELPVLNFGEISAREGINKVKEIISEEVEYEKEFAKIAKLEEIRAREYANNHGIDRIGIVEIVNVSHIKNLNSYLDDIKSWYSIPTKQYKGDAKILFVFVEDHSQLDQLQRQLDKGTGSQQLIVAVPKAPYTNIDKLFDLVAIKYIRENLAYQVGGENVDEEDLKSLEDDLYGTVREDVFNYTQADNCIWYYGDSRQASLHAGEDEKLLSEIMEGVFGETPLVIDEAINVTGRDTNKKHRKAAMAQLLEVEGNIRIKNEGGNASHRILRNTLRNTRLLEKVNDLGLEQEYIIRENILKDSPVYEIWKKFEDYFMQSEPSNFEELYFELVNPPIGVRVQLIELLLAAYLRKIKNQVLIFDSDRDFQQVHVNSNLIDNITKYPHRYFLTFFELIPEQKEFLEKMASVLSIEQEPAGLSLVEDVHVLLKGWFGNLSDGAKLSPELPSDIREFTKTLRENDSDDNVKDFVTVMIPKLLGQSPDKWHQGTASRLVEKFVEYKETLDNYSSRRGYMAVENLCNIFGTQGHTNEELITATTNWFNNLSEAQRLHHFSGSGAGLIKAIRTGTGSVEERFLIKLAKELTNRTFLNWESDDDMNEFLAEVRFGKTSVENWSINPPSDGKPLGGANKEKTLGVLKEEIYQLFAVHKTDNVDIISILQEILKDISQK